MAEETLTFVGRERELQLLGSAIDDACDGAGGLWLVSGEAGIGKSRLAEEAAEAARRAGMRVLWGRCWEAGGAPAYWPWVQVLRAMLRTSSIDIYDDHRVGLAQILPELADARAAPDADIGAEQAQFRLMDAVGAMLAESARRVPLLIVIEDLHVADESTLVLLDFLATLVRNQPLLLVGTLRPLRPDTPAGQHLSRALRNGRELALDRLDGDAVARFVRSGRDPLDERRIQSLHRATEGLPLFMVEIARLWRSHPAHRARDEPPVPATVRATIEERLATLPPEAVKVLSYGAIVGREFDIAVLRSSFPDSEPILDAALSSARAASMLEEVGIDRHRFSHILTRETVYEAIEPSERAAAHRQVAATLSELGGSEAPEWSAIAHHLRQAGPESASEASEAYRRAGARAMSQLAFTDAVHAFENALERRSTAAIPGDPAKVELTLELGRAQILAGDVQTGKDTCLRAAEQARSLGDAALFARAALQRGSALIFAHVDHSLVDLLTEALERLDDDDSGLRARVIARLAAAQQPAHDPEGPFAAARQAMAMARRIKDDEVLLATFRDGGSALVDLADANERLALDEEHEALAKKLGSRVERLRATSRLVLDYAELGLFAEADAAIDRCEAIARELAHAAYEWRAVAMRAAQALWRGDTHVALAHIERAGMLGIESGDLNSAPVYAIQKLRWLRIVGELDAQLGVIDDLERQWQEWGIGGLLLNAIIGQEHLIAGRREAALRRYDAGAVETALNVRDRTLQLALSRLCIAAGDEVRAGALYRGALAYEDTLVTGGALFLTFDEPMSGALGRLAAFLGRTEDARKHFDRAIAEAARNGGRPVRDALTKERDSSLGDDAPVPVSEEHTISVELVGESWVVRGGAVTFHLKDTKGVRMLARLLTEPGREFHVLELSGASETADEIIDRGDAGEMIDDDARRAYRRRAAQLRLEIERAESRGSSRRLDEAKAELEFLTTELARAVGLGGRTRRAGGASERARVNVQRRIRDAIRRVRAQDSNLAKQLDKQVRTGTFCAYEPP